MKGSTFRQLLPFPKAAGWTSSRNRRASYTASSQVNAAAGPVVFVDGVRTPFLTSLTDFQHLDGHSLLSASLRTLLQRTGVAPGDIEHVAAGCAYQDPRFC